MTEDRLTSEAGSTEGETFRERVDVSPPHVDDYVGRMAIGVRPSDHRQSAIDALLEENRTLRAYIAELEAELGR